jgi:DNA polymerase zeta
MDIVALHNPKIYQIDIKNAFLNENLDEEINMKQPKRFKVTRHERKLCKLVKSSYGLKQASKLWHEKFNNIMLSNDLNINEC